MTKPVASLQLIVFGNRPQTDLASVLRDAAQAGYAAIEAGNLYETHGENTVRQLLAETDLTVSGAHFGYGEPHLSGVEARNVALIVTEEQRLHDELATKPLAPTSIKGLLLEDARKLRYEIYARRGQVFKDRWLDGYFRSLSWYHPDPSYTERKLTDVDRKNVRILLAYERGAQKAANSVAA